MSFWTEGLFVMFGALAASAAVCGGAVALAHLARVDRALAWPFGRTVGPQDLINQVSHLADVARSEGLLSLERHATDLRQPMLTAGVAMVVEGVPAARILESIEAEACAQTVEGSWGRRIWAWVVGHPQAPAAAGTGLLLMILLNSAGQLERLGPTVAAVGLLAFLVASMAMAVAGAPGRIEAGAKAQQVLAGMIMARGMAMIREGKDGRTVRAGLMPLLPPVAREHVSRARAA